jgi:hypothetical protein
VIYEIAATSFLDSDGNAVFGIRGQLKGLRADASVEADQLLFSRRERTATSCLVIRGWILPLGLS